MKKKTDILKGTAIQLLFLSAMFFMIVLFCRNVECETIEKAVELQKDYTYCTFTVTGSDLDDTKGVLVSPRGVEYQLSYVQGVLVTTVESVKGGKWSLKLESDTDDLSDIKMSVDANTLVSKETPVDDTTVVKKITNLKSYLEDNTIHLSWTNSTNESVVISVADADNSTIIVDRESCKNDKWEYTLSEEVQNVIVTVVPYSYVKYDNAKTTLLLSKSELPIADVKLSVGERTNEEVVDVVVDTAFNYSVYNNGNRCSDSIDLIEGENLIVIKVSSDKGYISTYEYRVVKDTKPPVISLNQDINNASTEYENVTLGGKVKDATELYIQGNKVTFNDEGVFEATLNFNMGSNEVIIKAVDNTGNITEYVAYVTRIEPKRNGLIKNIILILIPLIALVVAGLYAYKNLQKSNKEKMDKKDEELSKAKEELENEKYDATHDELTKCKNRKAYDKDARNYDLKDICVIAFDVNNLKWTNDTLGHDCGDKLLLTISGILQDKFKDVYRMGGDEFNVLMKASDFNEETLIEVDELLKLYTENDIQSILYQVAYGYAFGDGNMSVSEIWKVADSRMYADKKEKKAQVGNVEKEDKKNVSLSDIDKALDKAENEKNLKCAKETVSSNISSSITEIGKIDKKKVTKSILGFIIGCVPFLITALLLALTLSKVIFIGKIESGSMRPTYEVGDVVIGSRLYYEHNDLKRGDTVFVNVDDKVLGKRIVGLSGDKITFENGYLCVNGDCIYEEYLSEEVETYGVGVYEVPENSVFLLGDNRDNSLDSRYWENPYISIDNIVAKNLLLIPQKYVLVIELGLGLVVIILLLGSVITKRI